MSHGVIRYYVNRAVAFGYVRGNPYVHFKVDKGEGRMRTKLDDAEILTWCTKEMPESVSVARDLYIFQMFTGCSFSDMRLLKPENIERVGEDCWLVNTRRKTHKPYRVYLLPKVMEVIEKYKGGKSLLPPVRLNVYNTELDVIAGLCGIKKHITSHTARHTYALILLRAGIPLEVIQSQMGHSKISTTQIYSKMEQEIVRRAMRGMNEK
jgi:integrase